MKDGRSTIASKSAITKSRGSRNEHKRATQSAEPRYVFADERGRRLQCRIVVNNAEQLWRSAMLFARSAVRRAKHQVNRLRRGGFARSAAQLLRQPRNSARNAAQPWLWQQAHPPCPHPQ